MKEWIGPKNNQERTDPLVISTIARKISRAGFCTMVSEIANDALLKAMAESGKFENATFETIGFEDLFSPSQETLSEMNSDADDIPSMAKYRAKLAELSSQQHTIFVLSSFKSVFGVFQKNETDKKTREEMLIIVTWFFDEMERDFEHFREEYQHLQNNHSGFLVTFSKEDYAAYLKALSHLQNGNIRELHPDINDG
ncbi:MAG: hypothetical protein JWM20_891 [Patescibacteria group bacterium]|nr:hypothetical protein [Patescibacteria group bacterium]